MAKYKVWLTVKDRYGAKKELSGGTINVDLAGIHDDEVAVLDKHFATDTEMAVALENSNETIRYSDFEFNEEASVSD